MGADKSIIKSKHALSLKSTRHNDISKYEVSILLCGIIYESTVIQKPKTEEFGLLKKVGEGFSKEVTTDPKFTNE